MAVELKFHYPITTLTLEGDYILQACNAHEGDLTERIPIVFVSESRSILTNLNKSMAGQQSSVAGVGSLTKAQNAKLAVLEDLMNRVRRSAKLAFKNEDVKLHSEFQVGVNKPSDLGSTIARARILATSCASSDNAAALAKEGWTAKDTKAVNDAIDGLESTDNTQETAKTTKSASTDARNALANDLNARLLAIQNAANLQWPASEPANRSIRAEFRLGIFPPNHQVKKTQPQPPAPPPAA
jgi:hypothetical protein